MTLEFTPYVTIDTAKEMLDTRMEFFKGELEKHKGFKLVIGFTDVFTRYDDKQTAFNVETTEDLTKIDLSLVKKIMYPNGKNKKVKVLPPCISGENDYQTPELYYGLY